MKIAVFKRYPATSYFFFAYLIAWGGTLWTIGQSGFRIFTGESVFAQGLSGQIMVVWLFMLAGPGIAGLLMTSLVDGKKGLKHLLARFLTWRVAFKWYAATLLIFPALLVLILYPLSFVSPAYSLGSAFALGLFAGLIGGSLEELGWTGFALPKLQLKYSPFAAGIILGIVHTFWHLLSDLWGGLAAYQSYYLLHFFLWILALTAFRLITVWIYNHTQSLLQAQLSHASFTGSQLAMGPTAPSVEQGIIWYALFTAALWIVAVIVVLQNKQMFMKKPAAREPY